VAYRVRYGGNRYRSGYRTAHLVSATERHEQHRIAANHRLARLIPCCIECVAVLERG
jgi:hypothetical protein